MKCRGKEKVNLEIYVDCCLDAKLIFWMTHRDHLFRTRIKSQAISVMNSALCSAHSQNLWLNYEKKLIYSGTSLFLYKFLEANRKEKGRSFSESLLWISEKEVFHVWPVRLLLISAHRLIPYLILFELWSPCPS